MQQTLFKILKQSLSEAGELSKVKLEHSSCPYCESKVFTLTKRDLVHTYKKVHKIIIPGVIHQYCNDCRQILPTPEEAQRMMALTSTFNKEVDKQNALQNFSRETSKSSFQQGGVVVLFEEADNHIYPATSCTYDVREG